MKTFSKLFVLLLLILNFSTAFAQKYYDAQWKKIEENSKKGAYKSNLPYILEIQNQAMKENNALQLIRSLKAEFSVVNQTVDDEKNDSASKFFSKLQNAEKQLKGDEKMIYQVLLSRFFLDYYNQDSWQIDGRTNINSQDVSQIETWSKLDFKNYLSNSYKTLDQQKAEMKKISLAKYKDIFSNDGNIDYFPTLLDWYSVRQIDFLSNNSLFTKNELAENQKKYNAIFDELISRNTGNAKLYFMHRKLSENCDFTQCKDKLEQLQKLVKSDTEGDYKVLIMESMMDELLAKKKEKEALAVADQAKSQYPESPFINNIKNKEGQIKNPFLSIKYEAQTQGNLPIHFVAEHKNASEFSLQIYEVKDDLTSMMQYIKNSYSNMYGKLKKNLVRKEVYQLPDLKDYQIHKTSLEIKPLPSGMYVVEYVVAGSDPKDENSRQNFYFLVSNNKVVYQNKSDRNQLSNELKLVSSENGKPVINENLTFYEFVTNKTLTKIDGKTDAKGVFRLPSTENKEYYRTFLIRQPKTNDVQIMQVYGNNDNAGRQDPNKQMHTKAQIFTDRAIYRPGQIVYFKVINTRIDKEIESVTSGLKQKITLLDANGEESSSQNFTTNEFGSYHGSFILPKGKLNGTFYLKTDDESQGYKDIRVEEYKRPKFEVTFDPVKGDYKYGQTIELKGKAAMFSGVALSNTTVNYEIKKHNIRWRYFWWYPQGDDNENSILGEAKTNDKGEFTIRLDLKKDEKLEGIQVDNYEISASVTDINGETQSAETQLKVASVSHYIKADEIKNVFADENLKLKVETKNYNEQNLKKSYQVKLSKLDAPDRIFRNNFNTEVQDLSKYSKDEFIGKFPHDLFDKNDEMKNWKAGKILFDKLQQSSADNAQLVTHLDLGKLEAGNYRLELYNIEGKDTIKSSQDFSVWDKRSLKPAQKSFLAVVDPKNEVVRGEKATIYAYSAIPDALANVFVQDGKGKTVSEVREFKNGVLEYVVDIPKDKSITTLNLQFMVVAFNDVQVESVNLVIKDSEQPLKIETVTFRDKLEPNVKEKWSVKISGNDKEKINAEVLANMYDMSLDQFAVNSFNWQDLYVPYAFITSYYTREYLQQKYYQKRLEYFNGKYVEVPGFNWFDGGIYEGRILSGRVADLQVEAAAMPAPTVASEVVKEEVVMTGAYRQKKMMRKNGANDAQADAAGASDEEVLDKVPVRQNLNETAFFYPDLKTDAEGNVSFEFTSPEALTKWKLMFLAHTKDARAATLQKEVVTQKEFSVTPNYPRFLREGDELNLQSKLSNLTDKKLKGSAVLQILDVFTNEDISSKFGLNPGTQNFDLNENGNSAVTWKIKVPENVSSIILKVVAKAGAYSDGEQQAVAVLPNRMLVTDAVPVFVKEDETKTFVLDNLQNTASTSISNVSNTLELTTNPIWEIMFALPSLKNDQNNSADVIFNKWFADVLASEIFRSNPKMKTVFEEYQNKGLLNSNLEKNQELKQLLLEETPWVLESKNEQEQMQKLALLFDANTMRNSINQDWDDFRKLQNPDGGFSWYSGYPSSYGVSMYILKNLGKINLWLKDNVKDYQSSAQNEMVAKLVQYVDNEIDKYWEVKKENIWNNWTLDYLDTRNYWEKQYPLKGKGATLKSLVKQKARTAKITDFTFFGLHRAALLMNNYGLKDTADKLMNYLKETSTDTKTQGIYWKQNLNDWGWFSSKVVNHAGALEAFNTLKPNDTKFIEDMKIWLITQKEVNSWGSSRGTAEVIFTILNSGKSWTGAESDKATIVWGGKELNPQTQATGYVKSTVKTDVVDKNLGTVTVTKPGPGIVQGGLFWQYYEDLDKIKSSENYISITKELYKKIKTVNGEELQKISSETPLKVGDKVTVRMILNTDRPMEFIHIKDMRAAGFEPVDVLSGYQWKNSLGYYQSTKDASTNFYIQYMPKGKYVFEYDFVANASGKFSNGITTMQNYYAPQMNTHTKGMNVQILE
ncbi:alpha-2-macroglobulin family protein [Chryseobacterium populi]|uniref:Large extracellular alpha-helical protein n=1 Tax=Chryseobacterium populi TaxID=1144316 RepID=J3CDC8_9FLAO|nr:alpha-2-macroglobulin family protein [Chryseobacterium populi]EJL69181.1 large extracellular alpha-helical protein [Chryseobacterium populi]